MEHTGYWHKSICFVRASLNQIQRGLRSARSVENIFDSEVQCHFIFVPETLIRQSGPLQSIISEDGFARRPRRTVPSSSNLGTNAPTGAGLPAAEKTNSKETSQLKPSFPPFLTTIIPSRPSSHHALRTVRCDDKHHSKPSPFTRIWAAVQDISQLGTGPFGPRPLPNVVLYSYNFSYKNSLYKY